VSDDPTKDLMEAGVKWSLDEIKEKVADWIYKFKNRKLLFVHNKDNIIEVNSVERSKEQMSIKLYIKDKDILILSSLGTVLRRNETNINKIRKLREAIYARYGAVGIHTACFFQNGLFYIYFKEIIESNLCNDEITRYIEATIKQIDKIALFVSKEDSEEKIADILKTRMYADSKYSYLLLSYNVDAMKKCEDTKAKLTKMIGIKNLQIIKYDDTKRLIYIFKLKDTLDKI